jgi:hypothetical protein
MRRHIALAASAVLALVAAAVALSASAPGPNGSNGWYRSPFTIDFDIPGFTCTPDQEVYSGNGTNIVRTANCTNGVDPDQTDSFGPFDYDGSAPTISGSKSPSGDGWTTSNVTVSFVCADVGPSGLASCTPNQVVSSEGANQSRVGTATDVAGNSSQTTVGNINIDKSDPSISGSRSPSPNGAGWNNTDVTVTFACNDGLSGIASCTGPQVVTTNGANQSRNGTAVDNAGNSAQATVAGISIDKLAPSITGSKSVPGSGWTNLNVTVSFECTDAGASGIASCTPDEVVSSEGANQSRVGTATDVAGNSSQTTVGNINIDKTGPGIAGSRSPAPNAAGWNNTNVVVSYVCDDGLSGVDTCQAPQTVSTDGANQQRTGTALDNAGNTSQTTVTGINIDRAQPNVSGAATTAPNSFGWYTTDVTVDFTCTDPLSGVAVCPADQVLQTEGANQSVQGTGTDNAGNSRQVTVGGISIDKTSPVVAVVPDVVAEATGPSGAEVSFDAPTATDNLVDGPVPVLCDVTSPSLFALGTTPVTCSASDGHGTAPGSSTFNVSVVDTTSPVLPNHPFEIVVEANTPSGATREHPTIAAVLNLKAKDIVDPAPTVFHDAPEFFPFGDTTVVIGTSDRFGNKGFRSTKIVVVQPGFRPPTILDLTPPGNPKGVSTEVGERFVTLTWKKAVDAVEYVVTRTGGVALAQTGETVVYRGKKTTFTDRNVRKGIQYRYVIQSVDTAGNLSAGVAVIVTPRAILLVKPKNGSRVSVPVELRWAPVRGASYYNVQIFRDTGRGTQSLDALKKIHTAWPKLARYTIPLSWVFEGKKLTLKPGKYRWYVWPGYGKRADGQYGQLLGQSSFTVVATPKGGGTKGGS